VILVGIAPISIDLALIATEIAPISVALTPTSAEIGTISTKITLISPKITPIRFSRGLLSHSRRQGHGESLFVSIRFERGLLSHCHPNNIHAYSNLHALFAVPLCALHLTATISLTFST
jgi:hypothetical protein